MKLILTLALASIALTTLMLVHDSNSTASAVRQSAPASSELA
jgi:hypothetical protein